MQLRPVVATTMKLASQKVLDFLRPSKTNLLENNLNNTKTFQIQNRNNGESISLQNY